MKSRRLTFRQHGDPAQVLKLGNCEIPPPAQGDALLEMRAAAINPSDLGTIGGSYGTLPDLPATAGLEGVATVLEDCGELRQGDLVRIPPGLGTWQTHLLAPAKDLLKVPADIPADQAATAFVNPPTAWLLLREVVQLQPGDWVVQNAANSAVGIAVIQIARNLGLRTANLVRRPELVQPLLNLGADAVLLDDDDAPGAVTEHTGGERPKLALNSVGGHSAYRLCKMLGRSGSHVTFGAMTGEPTRFPTRFLLFNDIRLTGFWVTRWLEEAGPGVAQAVEEQIFSLLRQGVLRTQIEATYPLQDWQSALQHNARPRLGKVLFQTGG